MLKKIILVFGVFMLASVILLVSIFNSSAVSYPVSNAPVFTVAGPKVPEINYPLPHMGNILPDSPLWNLKAFRDKVWFGITASHLRKAQLALLFSDKRLLMTQELFKRGKPDIAVSTFTKGEKYLAIAVSEEKIARDQGIDTEEFLLQLAASALKHREVAENLIYLVPEEASPLLVKTECYAKSAFEEARNALNSKGIPVPKNPFDGD